MIRTGRSALDVLEVSPGFGELRADHIDLEVDPRVALGPAVRSARRRFAYSRSTLRTFPRALAVRPRRSARIRILSLRCSTICRIALGVIIVLRTKLNHALVEVISAEVRTAAAATLTLT